MSNVMFNKLAEITDELSTVVLDTAAMEPATTRLTFDPVDLTSLLVKMVLVLDTPTTFPRRWICGVTCIADIQVDLSWLVVWFYVGLLLHVAMPVDGFNQSSCNLRVSISSGNDIDVVRSWSFSARHFIGSLAFVSSQLCQIQRSTLFVVLYTDCHTCGHDVITVVFRRARTSSARKESYDPWFA